MSEINTEMDRQYRIEQARLLLINLLNEKKRCEELVAQGSAAKKRLKELDGNCFNPGEIHAALYNLSFEKSNNKCSN